MDLCCTSKDCQAFLLVIDGESNESFSSTINCACVKQGNGFLAFECARVYRRYEVWKLMLAVACWEVTIFLSLASSRGWLDNERWSRLYCGEA